MAKRSLRDDVRFLNLLIIHVFWFIILLAAVDLVLLKIAFSNVGALLVVGWIVISALLGVTLARYEGLRMLYAYREALLHRTTPDEGIVDGVLVLLGGVLLILPGTIADAAGLLLLVPVTRKLVAELVRARLTNRFQNVASSPTPTFDDVMPDNPMQGGPMHNDSISEEPMQSGSVHWVRISAFKSSDPFASMFDLDSQREPLNYERNGYRERGDFDVIDTEGVTVQDALLLPRAPCATEIDYVDAVESAAENAPKDASIVDNIGSNICADNAEDAEATSKTDAEANATSNTHNRYRHLRCRAVIISVKYVLQRCIAIRMLP